MILSALISFLGGATVRALIGHAISWLEKKQNHVQEMERMKLQAAFDDEAHARQQESIRLQAELGVQQVRVAGDAAIGLEEAKAFSEAMKTANQPTGVRWIDGWNGAVRPATATLAIALWALKFIKGGMTLTAWDESLIGSVLGYYFADRQLGKRK